MHARICREQKPRVTLINPMKTTITLRTASLWVLVLCAGVLRGRADVLTMDELPFQPVNGLTFKGVTFHFTIAGNPSSDANYHGSNGGIETYVQDPSLEGNALGTLTLDFVAPTAGLQFGVARNMGGALTPGLQVSLYDASLSPLGNYSLNTSVHNTFSEGQFNSALTIGRAVLTFPNAGAATRFAIDNLVVTPVPEPGPSGLSALALVCFGAARCGLHRIRGANG